ncbi:thiosulfate oxidation carrier complex protein SoxZ [Sulfurimonas sp. HSL-1656]|uniref:thiosulfate oxidation carrier complex protein SoxZ n=1 Tax=Thiomicrolovo subterrani TaxID=3131934 RepID=UPI0031F90D74
MAERKSLIKIKPKKFKSGDVVKVNFMVMHPMETGMRKDKKSGKIVPADYITEVKFFYNDTPFTTMQVWESVSTNPVFTINFKVPAAGTLKVVYKTNTGEVQEQSKKLKPKG